MKWLTQYKWGQSHLLLCGFPKRSCASRILFTTIPFARVVNLYLGNMQKSMSTLSSLHMAKLTSSIEVQAGWALAFAQMSDLVKYLAKCDQNQDGIAKTITLTADSIAQLVKESVRLPRVLLLLAFTSSRLLRIFHMFRTKVLSRMDISYRLRIL